MEVDFDIIALILLGGLVLLTLGVSLIPVRLRVVLNSDVKSLRINFWKLTIVDSDSLTSASSGKSRKDKKEPDGSGSDGAEGKETNTVAERLLRFLKYLGVAPKIAKALLGFVVRLLRKLKFCDISGSISGGLENPADTGMAFGALYAILGAVPVLQPHLRVKPDYLAERMEYSFQGEITLRPIALLGPTFRLFHELPKRELIRIVKIWRKRRKSGKPGV